MRLLDTYATNTGSVIDEPYIYTKFFPIPDKYITLQSQTPYDSRNYSYWEEVIEIIKPFLDKENIKILQIGKNGELPIPNTINFLGKTDINQLAYVMQNSLLHFGADSLCVHLASHFDKPIVSIYSISNPNVAGPHFGDKNKHILIKAYENVGTKKPSYSQSENPKSIDTVKPEEIAANILNLLKIYNDLKYKTLITGDKFKQKVLEFVPDRVLNPEFAKDSAIAMRIDLCENIDEQLIFHNLKMRKFILLLNNKNKIDIQIFQILKTNILEIVFDCTDEEPDKDYIKNIILSGHIPVMIYKGDDLDYFNNIKINFIDLNIKFAHLKSNDKNIDEFKKICNTDTQDICIKSNKIILSKDKMFLSEAHFIENKHSNANFDKLNVLSNKENLLKEIDFLHIYRI